MRGYHDTMSAFCRESKADPVSTGRYGEPLTKGNVGRDYLLLTTTPRQAL